MSVQVEKLEKNMAKLTVEVSAEDFKAAIKKAFNKNKNRFAIPGFRKGKAPQAMIEKMYGEGVFYEDAADEAINASYKRSFPVLDRYERVNCYLDRDEAGRRTLEALRKRYADKIVDCSSLYKGYKDLNEYLQNKFL